MRCQNLHPTTHPICISIYHLLISSHPHLYIIYSPQMKHLVFIPYFGVLNTCLSRKAHIRSLPNLSYSILRQLYPLISVKSSLNPDLHKACSRGHSALASRSPAHGSAESASSGEYEALRGGKKSFELRILIGGPHS